MSDHAKIFRALHHGPSPLILANAWDAGSARLIESLGAKAIATTSAGVDWTLGYPDGNLLPPAQLAKVVAEMARVIKIPLTVDFEAGYSDDPAGAAENIKPILDAGAVGINLEDGEGTPELMAAKIEAIKKAAASRGIDLFINARTDVYRRNLVPDDKRAAESLARAKLYQNAGADGLFVLGVTKEAEIREIVAGTTLPLNVLVRAGLAPVKDLATWGVKRLSCGSGLAQVMWGHVAELARNFLEKGESGPLLAKSFDYGALQALFSNASK
jgi:2-methylisocitrate lyase-like PEP mutase family enzyme